MNYFAITIAIIVLIALLLYKPSREYLFQLFNIDKVKLGAKLVEQSPVMKGYIYNSYALTYLCLFFFIIFEVYAVVNFFQTFNYANLMVCGSLLLLILVAKAGVWLNFKFANIKLYEKE